MLRSVTLRFSLFSLFLVVTIVGLCVSHWLTSQRLHVAKTKIGDQRREIRDLSHKLGLLTDEDLPHVQVRRVFIEREPPDSRGDEFKEFDIDWDLHLPAHKKWRLRWSDKDIPQRDLPATATGFRDLPSNESGWTQFHLCFLFHGALGCSAEFHYGDEDWSWMIPGDRTSWLERGSETASHCAGPWDHHTDECSIKQFPCELPIVLYRERQLIVTGRHPNAVLDHDSTPCPGFIVWLEAADEIARMAPGAK